MIKTFLNRVTFVGVEDKHFSKEVQSSRVGVGVNFVPFLLASLGLFPQEFALTLSYNELFIFSCGCSKNSNSPLNLV
mgnify:CR=1 FL=1